MGAHQLDVADLAEAERLAQLAGRVLGEVEALVAQHHVHEHPADALRHHHARLVALDPLVHVPLGVPLQERVQLDVPAAQQRAGAAASHAAPSRASRPVSDGGSARGPRPCGGWPGSSGLIVLDR